MTNDDKLREALKLLDGKSWEELDVTEDQERLYIPEVIHKRGAGAEWKEVKIMLELPLKEDLIAARVEAKALAFKREIDREKDKDLFDDIENSCILAHAIRDREPMPGAKRYPQHTDVEDLLKTYHPKSLDALWGRMEVYSHMMDPRIQAPDEHTVFSLVAAINQVGNLLPLAGIAGHAQPSLLLSMAKLAADSPTAQSYFASYATSKREQLARKK